jgi:hypothetical protein
VRGWVWTSDQSAVATQQAGACSYTSVSIAAIMLPASPGRLNCLKARLVLVPEYRCTLSKPTIDLQACVCRLWWIRS